MTVRKINLVSFHGLRSQGDNLEILVNRLEHDIEASPVGVDVITSQHDYPRLGIIKGMGGWERDCVREFILKCLSLEFYRDLSREIIVLCHSNATFGLYNALEKYKYSRSECERLKIDRLLLFGSTIPCDFNWGDYPDIQVINFIGKKDKVVRFGKLYGMGRSGRNGFSISAPNLKQISCEWTHSQFADDASYGVIRPEVLDN